MTVKKYFIETHGCQMNEYDSGRMGDLLQAAYGFEATDRPEEADVILLNTCSSSEQRDSEFGLFSSLQSWWCRDDPHR